MNPEEKVVSVPHTDSLLYDYPSSVPDVPHIIYDNGTFYGLPLFSLTITYSYDDTLAEGVPFFITASGALYPEGQQTIERVDVGYQGASFPSGLANYPPTYTANLHNATALTITVPPTGETKGLDIKWNTQGDYYPYLSIFYKNGSVPNTITLQDGKMHVFGIDTLNQQEHDREQSIIDRRNNAMVLDLGLIPLFGAVAGLVLKLQLPFKKKISNDTKSNENQSNPKGDKGYFERHGQKPKPKPHGKNKH